MVKWMVVPCPSTRPRRADSRASNLARANTAPPSEYRLRTLGVSGVRSNPFAAAHAATSAPPPFTTVMSSASTRTCWRTMTPLSAGAARATRSNTAGLISRSSRSSVQPPPFSIFTGTPGSGMM